ncbi:MAG: helix-hairpin-helix domain-containing protein [Gammaproteobacteria bacterium]|nr:helix-hairpin-helix domain-containing protein [Gammaproteobacteria bacterium]MDH4254789.1 helix-hairpin-helix domain-containing protein [Gammaproteobacteria bacterium]MDH5310785.1 helix-hairpin-helix domain-containing protein [Gammaproteobacteria bacterium]
MTTRLYPIAIAAVLAFASTVQADGLLDANSASAEELAAVGGLDEAAIALILEERPYAGIIDLDEALSETLNVEQRAQVYAGMFLRINLNTATRDEIMTIPGMDRRMAHEFEEYRPYTSMEQFRREIGKYVDEKEVARLEMYVTLD